MTAVVIRRALVCAADEITIYWATCILFTFVPFASGTMNIDPISGVGANKNKSHLMLLFLQTAIIELACVDVIAIGHDRCWRLLDGTAAEGGCLLSMNNVKH